MPWWDKEGWQIFLAGLGVSGTTWLARILNRKRKARPGKVEQGEYDPKSGKVEFKKKKWWKK